MFLRPLNKEQKSLFLALATKAAAANNVIEESEQQLLNAYADEMDISSSDASNLGLEEILKQLKKISTDIELNQIMFELVGMMMSDMSYDDEEKKFLSEVASVLEISQEKIDMMFECVISYSELIKKINLLMFN